MPASEQPAQRGTSPHPIAAKGDWCSFGALVALVVAASQPVLAQPRPPELIDIVPASGPAGAAYPLQATIRGTGFMPAGNVVEFGPVTIRDLPSVDGVRMTFGV